MLKIKLLLGKELYDSVAEELTASGCMITEDTDFILTENRNYPDLIIGKRDGEIFRLKLADITHIESLGHDIIAHCGGREYKLSERLIRLQNLLNPEDFLRISNSVIVNVHCIQSIKPALSARFILTLSDGCRVDVTRSYYYIFKDFFKI